MRMMVTSGRWCFFLFFGWVTGELPTLRQMMKPATIETNNIAQNRVVYQLIKKVRQQNRLIIG